jgi:hypothetical protein
MSSPIETRDRLDESDSETVRRHAATFRRVRLARLAAVEAESERPSDQPAPQVPGREASSDEVPRGAAGIAKHARAYGWTVREVYSRGPGRAGEESSDDASDEGPSSEESSDRIGVELVTVRCRRSGEKPSDERWACAVYRRPGSKWVLDACLVADASDGLRRVKSAELRAYLAIP